jgi:hypothetical protein
MILLGITLVTLGVISLGLLFVDAVQHIGRVK